MTRLERRPELVRDDARRRRRIVDAPERRERGGAEEEDERHQQRLPPGRDEPPVVGDEEADDRAPPRARVVHGLAALAHERLEPHGLRRPRGVAAQPREIRGRRAVEPAEAQDSLRPEPLGTPSRLAQEQLELVPVRTSRGDESV